MKILLTGANGYIGKRLLLELAEEGHLIVCCVRDKNRFNPPQSASKNIEVIEVDFLKPETLSAIPKDIQGAYYLIHSMTGNKAFKEMEVNAARNFKKAVEGTQLEHVIYLSGIVNEDQLSEHLQSRLVVEETLGEGAYHLTTFRAGIIIGSGSASFEIIRDLVEKLPLMIAPKWLKTKCQPIAVRDVLAFLKKGLHKKELYDKNFDIGSPDVLSYKEMLMGYAKARGLWRKMMIVPVMTPKLSSYWLYFITSTSYKLASSLVDSMKVEVVCRPSEINQMLNIEPMSYAQALEKTLTAINDHRIVSSWKDALVSSEFENNISEFITVPENGCFKDLQEEEITNKEKTLDNIWQIGGTKGWYYANWLWKIRGYLDKLAGGVGLRRGRTHPTKLSAGDAVDFWRVIYAHKEEGRLLLYAEMKLPGEAWLEFKIKDKKLIQTATFRPKGLWGRIYWFSVLPFHFLIFKGMIRRITSK